MPEKVGGDGGYRMHQQTVAVAGLFCVMLRGVAATF